MADVFGAIEAGGTKFVCAVGTGPEDLQVLPRIKTTTPADTLERAVAALLQQAGTDRLLAVGIASFGPIDLDPTSASFGYITSTPKPGWANTDVAGTVRRALGVPVGFDTDVNAAGLGEHRWGAAQGLDTFIYLTVGTGIGGGGLVNGKLMHGLVHPEMGHIRVPRDHAVDPYSGYCPYHGDCLEGLASGRAIKERWGAPGEMLPAEHPAWDLEAHYLAVGLADMICTLSPQRIILGGGVMSQVRLLPLVRRKVQEALNGYIRSSEILTHVDRYLVAPGLGNRSGVLGAIALAQDHLLRW